MAVLGPSGLHKRVWPRGQTHFERPVDVVFGDDLGVLPGELHALGWRWLDVDDVGLQLMRPHCLNALEDTPPMSMPRESRQNNNKDVFCFFSKVAQKWNAHRLAGVNCTMYRTN